MTASNCPYCGKAMPKHRTWTADDDATLERMLAAGTPRKAIAEALGRPYSSIASRLATLAKRDLPEAGMDDSPSSAIANRPGVRVITHRIRG